MLLRISLIVAILCGLAVGVLNFVVVKEKVGALKTAHDEEKKQKETAQSELSKTKADLAKTEKELNATKATLDETTVQRDKAVQEAADLTKKSADLTEKLAKATAERNEAQQDLSAYKATGYNPAQILGFGNQIKKLEKDLAAVEEEKTFFAKRGDRLQAELDKYTKPDYHGPECLPASLTAKVVAADPKWEFVVLDIGDNKGVLKDTQLLVSRGSKLVAKVVVTDVQKEKCIANVMDGWRVGDVLEGDVVIPAYPVTGSL